VIFARLRRRRSIAPAEDREVVLASAEALGGVLIRLPQF
jgi:hypothetical protein